MTCEDQAQELWAEREQVEKFTENRWLMIMTLWDLIATMRAESAADEWFKWASIRCDDKWRMLSDEIREWRPEYRNHIDTVKGHYLAALEDIRCQDAGWEERILKVKRLRNDLLSLSNGAYEMFRAKLASLCEFKTNCLLDFVPVGSD